jgi:hypothetical protein
MDNLSAISPKAGVLGLATEYLHSDLLAMMSPTIGWQVQYSQYSRVAAGMMEKPNR